MRLTRRAFGAGLVAAAASPLLLPRLALGQEAQTVRAQMGWLKTVEYGGYWKAEDAGYYRDAGVSPDWLPGGPNIPATPPIVMGGQADIGIGEQLLSVADAVATGADLVVFGTVFQKSPSGIVSLPKAPIRTAKDIVGKRIGLQAGAKPFIDAILSINGLPNDYTVVPVSFDPQPLVEGACDGMVCFVTNQPITLKLQGIPYETATFFDLGLPSYAGVLYSTRRYLDANRKAVVGLVKATRRGWQDYLADPAAVATLTVERFGEELGLNADQQREQALGQAPLITPPEGQEVMSMSKELIDGPFSKVLQATGRTNMPPTSKWIDYTIVEEAAG